MAANRTPMFVVKVVALLVVAGVVVSIALGREAEAQIGSLTGVYCLDLYTDGESPVTPKGSPHQSDDGIDGGPHDGKPETKIMTRIEPSDNPQFDWDMTSVSYRGPGGFSVTEPPSDDPCATKGDNNTLNVDQQPVPLIGRPTNGAKEGVKSSQKVLQWDICSLEEDLGFYVNTHWNVIIDASPPYYGELLVDIGGVGICSSTAQGLAERLIVEMYKRDLNAGAPSGGLDDDWDGDGVTDWNELGENPPAGFCDPFTDPPCDIVGGIAGLPEVTNAPARAADRAGGGVNALVATVIAVAAGATGIVAGAWYLRRRRAD